jgi:hypothetical protein
MMAGCDGGATGWSPEQVKLVAKDFLVRSLVERGIPGGDVRVELESLAYKDAMVLATRLRLWGEDDDPRLIASYPATLWDHIKQVLRLRHKRRYVYQQETIVYPSLAVRPGEQCRVFVEHYTKGGISA